MQLVTPIWSDGVAVIPATTLSFGNSLRGTLDLRAAFGGMLFVKIGRKGTAAPSSSIKVRVRRLLRNDAPGGAYPAVLQPLIGNVNAGQATTVNADSAAGQAVLHVASTVSFGVEDLLGIYDAAFTRLEFALVSKVIAGALVLDRPLGFAHLAVDADNVTKQADVFAPLQLHGGALWEVIVDYGAATSGADYVVESEAQKYDHDSIV